MSFLFYFFIFCERLLPRRCYLFPAARRRARYNGNQVVQTQKDYAHIHRATAYGPRYFYVIFSTRYRFPPLQPHGSFRGGFFILLSFFFLRQNCLVLFYIHLYEYYYYCYIIFIINVILYATGSSSPQRFCFRFFFIYFITAFILRALLFFISNRYKPFREICHACVTLSTALGRLFRTKLK